LSSGLVAKIDILMLVDAFPFYSDIHASSVCRTSDFFLAVCHSLFLGFGKSCRYIYLKALSQVSMSNIRFFMLCTAKFLYFRWFCLFTSGKVRVHVRVRVRVFCFV